MIRAFTRWLHAHIPTRDGSEANRYLRPFAHNVLRAELWRFSRRSVPRGVALGLFVGTIFPFAHSFIGAILAVFVAANVPVAFATAWLVGNPVTYLAIIWPLANVIGHGLNRLGLVPNAPSLAEMIARWMPQTESGHHRDLLHHVIAWSMGLLVEAGLMALVGYFVAGVVWRLRVSRRWRSRLRRVSAA